MDFKVLFGILFLTMPAFGLAVPDACIERNDYPCALSSAKGRTTFQLKSGGKLILDQGSKVLMKSVNEVSLIQGTLAYLGDQNLQLVHGVGRVQAHGEVLFSRHEQELKLSVLAGQVEISGPGVEKETLTSGWSQKIGVLDPLKGRLVVEVAAPFEFAPTVTQWFQIRGALAEGMAQELQQYKKHWQQALEQASNAYSKESSNIISQARDEREARTLARQKNAQETKRLRDLFRDRSL